MKKLKNVVVIVNVFMCLGSGFSLYAADHHGRKRSRSVPFSKNAEQQEGLSENLSLQADLREAKKTAYLAHCVAALASKNSAQLHACYLQALKLNQILFQQNTELTMRNIALTFHNSALQNAARSKNVSSSRAHR